MQHVMNQWEAYLNEPPADKPLFECDMCGQEICEGYDYYAIKHMRICPDCIKDNLKIAEE